MKEISINIQKLFEYIEQYDSHLFELDVAYIQSPKIQIKNEKSEWINIIGLIKKRDLIRILTFDDGTILKVGDNHLICTNFIDCVASNTLKLNDVVIDADGTELKLIDIRTSDESDVFDFCVDSKEKLYQTSNGIIHHNTFLASAVALDMIFKGLKSKIVITRPTVSTEDIGFLPGTFEEKMEPWLVPIRDNMRKFYNNPAKLKKMEEDGVIEIVSLAHFRGRTFQDSVCIIDESQNLTINQLKMALGRIGKGSIMIFCGDIDQIDLKQSSTSSIHAIHKLAKSKHVSIIELKENHRHPAVHDLLELLK